jgi:phage terminase large subunit
MDNYVYDYFVIHTANNKKLIHTTYKDNKFLPPDYVESLEALKETNPHYYKVYVLGEWASLDKLILPNVKVVDGIDIKQFSRSDIGVGLDFGFTADPTAIVLTAYEASKRSLYIIDEVYGHEMLTDDIADAIKDKGWTKYRIVGDSSEARTIRELNLKGIPIAPSKKGNKSIVHGVTFLQQQNIFVSKKCTNYLMETRNYAWAKDRNGKYINKPIDKYNHLVDATRYIMERYALTRTGGANTRIKQILGL